MTDFNDEVIRSADNRIPKYIRSLRQRKTREAERAFVVEGVRAVEDALDAGGRARLVLVRAGSELPVGLFVGGASIRRVAPALFNQLAETEHPQPVIGVFDQPELDVAVTSNPLYVVADGVQDPGNLGTLLRSSAAAGATSVLIGPGSVDPFNGKVVRAAMGAHFRVPIRSLDEAWQARLETTCPLRVLADSEAEMRYDDVDWTVPAVLIVGSEAHGPSNVGLGLATVAASIPLENGVESLNAGVAAAIMLFEAARQRRKARTT
ncbi:MAG: RNA methyltransferase [Thermomicrobiales bacterium]|nr:RNA methyltransferase [Thermomicrobiales bacterium]